MIHDCDKPQSLVMITRNLLIQECAYGKNLVEIHVQTNIPYHWLVAFKENRKTAQNPGVNRIQYLYEYLTNKKLEV